MTLAIFPVDVWPFWELLLAGTALLNSCLIKLFRISVWVFHHFILMASSGMTCCLQALRNRLRLIPTFSGSCTILSDSFFCTPLAFSVVTNKVSRCILEGSLVLYADLWPNRCNGSPVFWPAPSWRNINFMTYLPWVFPPPQCTSSWR